MIAFTHTETHNNKTNKNKKDAETIPISMSSLSCANRNNNNNNNNNKNRNYDIITCTRMVAGQACDWQFLPKWLYSASGSRKVNLEHRFINKYRILLQYIQRMTVNHFTTLTRPEKVGTKELLTWMVKIPVCTVMYNQHVTTCTEGP